METKAAISRYYPSFRAATSRMLDIQRKKRQMKIAYTTYTIGAIAPRNVQKTKSAISGAGRQLPVPSVFQTHVT